MWHGHVIGDLKDKEIGGTFYEKELQKTNQKEFRVEKVIKRKDDKLYVKWKGYDNSFNSWIDKKDILLEEEKVELSLSNYATKTDLTNARVVRTSKFAKTVYLASLKSNVAKLDLDKLKNVPSNLTNLKSR